MTSLITTPLANGPVAVRGALDIEHTPHGLLPHRLPATARAQFPGNHLARFDGQPLAVVEAQPSHNTWPARHHPLHRPARRAEEHRDLAAPGGDHRTHRPAHRHPVDPPTPSGRRGWLHYGSSLSHGAEATSPTGTWPAIAARLAGVELTNLGLGSNALLDPFAARAIRDTDADLISLKIGLNLVNSDLMRLRALGPAVHGFLDTIRDGHPDTPLLVVSPILCPIIEDAPGPTMPDFDASTLRFLTLGHPGDLATGRLSLNIVRDELARITAERATTDPNLHYLDGRALYGEQDFAELPLPDQIHPDAAGYQRIGERFAHLAFGHQGPWSAEGHARRGISHQHPGRTRGRTSAKSTSTGCTPRRWRWRGWCTSQGR